MVSARGGKGDPGGRPFSWRGIEFAPPSADVAHAFYSSEPITVAGDRTADWKVQRLRGEPARWAARLRIGAERYPGTGATHVEALHAAAGEASNVAAYIVAMLPPGGGLAGISELAARRRARKYQTLEEFTRRGPRRAIKVRRK